MIASGLKGMVSGQSLDLTMLQPNNVSKQELIKIHQLKTGYLISACIKTVLIAKGYHDDAIAANLTNYANELGVAFQIQDDYLDTYGITEKLGKQQGSDIANEKTTFASLSPKNELLKLINHTYDEAINYLRHNNIVTQNLIDFTQYLRSRSH